MKQQITEQVAQLKGGYIIAGGIGSTPVWVTTLTDVAQLVAILVAICVGATTFYMNVKRIKYYKNKEIEDAAANPGSD